MLARPRWDDSHNVPKEPMVVKAEINHRTRGPGGGHKSLAGLFGLCAHHVVDGAVHAEAQQEG